MKYINIDLNSILLFWNMYFSLDFFAFFGNRSKFAANLSSILRDCHVICHNLRSLKGLFPKSTIVSTWEPSWATTKMNPNTTNNFQQLMNYPQYPPVPRSLPSPPPSYLPPPFPRRLWLLSLTFSEIMVECGGMLESVLSRRTIPAHPTLNVPLSSPLSFKRCGNILLSGIGRLRLWMGVRDWWGKICSATLLTLSRSAFPT